MCWSRYIQKVYKLVTKWIFNCWNITLRLISLWNSISVTERRHKSFNSCTRYNENEMNWLGNPVINNKFPLGNISTDVSIEQFHFWAYIQNFSTVKLVSPEIRTLLNIPFFGSLSPLSLNCPRIFAKLSTNTQIAGIRA